MTMKNDNEKTDRQNNKEISRSNEILKRIFAIKGFDSWVKKVRKIADIPVDGLAFKHSEDPDKDGYCQWILKEGRKIKIIDEEISEFCERFLKGKVDVYLWKEGIFNYVVTGSLEQADDLGFGCILLSRGEATTKEGAREITELAKVAVPIFIMPYASQRYVIQFIKSNWRTIEFFNNFDIQKTKIKGSLVPKTVQRKDLVEMMHIAGINLSFRKRRKEEEHKKIYQLYKNGFIKSDGTLNIKKAFNWAELGLPSQNSDNVRKIIHTQKRLANLGT